MKPIADSICYGRLLKRGDFSGEWRGALTGDGCRENRAPNRVQRFGYELRGGDGQQRNDRGQRRTQVVRCQAQFAAMRWQPILVIRRMPDGMRPRRQLGEEENGNEKEMAQGIHSESLVDLNE
jgi:hypothetical protein